METVIETKKNNIFEEYILPCLFGAFTLCVFAPIEFYYGNIANVWYELTDIMPMVVLTFFAAFFLLIVIALAMRKLGDVPYQVFVLAIIITTICLYIQGNFMPAKYSKLGDETINWAEYTVEGYSNTLIWAGAIMVLAALAYKIGIKKSRYFFKVVTICILLVQLVTLTTVSITSRGLKNSTRYVATTEKEYSYSQNDNLIIILLDAFDSRIMTDLLGENEEKYSELFEDFTFYENTVGSFGLTDFAVPHILTGEKYLNQCLYGDYANEAYEKSPLFDELRCNNYDLGVYTTVSLPQGKCTAWFDNWHKVDYSVESKWEFWKDYNRLLAFRYFPHYLKRVVYFDVDEMDAYRKIATVDGHTAENGEVEVFPWGNIEFYENIPSIEADIEKPAFRFIHLKGVHSYRNMHTDMQVHEKEMELTVNEEGVVVAEILDDYLEKLKDLDIFDKSAIVIMADHGSNAYPVGGKTQTPLLLVKGVNEKHDFTVSQAPISYDDMQTCFLRLMQKETGNELFDVKEGDERARYIYFTGFNGPLNTKSKSEKFTEFVVNGMAHDTSSMKETGLVFK